MTESMESGPTQQAFCAVTRTLREFHFCCPDNCALEVSPDGE